MCPTPGQKRFLFYRLKGLSDVSEVDAWFVGPVIMRASSLLELDPPDPSDRGPQKFIHQNKCISACALNLHGESVSECWDGSRFTDEETEAPSG